MRTMRPTPHPGVTDGALPPSALQLTRAAIARWRGKPPSDTLPPGLFRVSAQARHLAQAQRGLAEWIAQGGFSQYEEIVMPALLLRAHGVAPAPLPARADACIG